jgi:endoglucanase
MDKTALEFFQRLMATPTPSGCETAGQKVVTEYMRRFAARVDTDAYGNVIGVLNPDAERRVMLAGHCDEIGLMVQYIDENGFLYMSAIGGVHPPLLQGERVRIHTARGPVPGVIGVKPIHLMTAKERENATPRIDELWVDIGAGNRKDAEKAVALGDVATIATGWIELRNGLVACRGFDNRAGAFVVADVLRLLKRRKLNVGVYAVSTVQEEVGLRGARMAAFGIDPHLGIAVDVGFATDYPEVNKKQVGEARLGAGPILHRGPTYSPDVFAGLQRAAARLKIKTQLQPEPRGQGTDAYAIQMNRAGVPSALVSIPNRYMHTPVETIALRDVERAVRLIAGYVAGLTASGA